MLYRIWNLIVKELIQLRRDRLMVFFVLFGPLTELLMVAWSTSQGINHLPTAVLDLDRTAASRGLITAVANTETFDPYFVETMAQVSDDVGSGRAMAAWVIPAGFQAQLNDAAADPPQVQVIMDGADVVAAQTAAEVAPGIVASYGQEVAL
ncbi:MAG: ABC transporter permease [Anaerolineales bacterium]|nr:ABC transporter permease [Anaerolineales bacterium]